MTYVTTSSWIDCGQTPADSHYLIDIYCFWSLYHLIADRRDSVEQNIASQLDLIYFDYRFITSNCQCGN